MVDIMVGKPFTLPYELSPDKAGSKGVTWKAPHEAIMMTREGDDIS